MRWIKWIALNYRLFISLLPLQKPSGGTVYISDKQGNGQKITYMITQGEDVPTCHISGYSFHALIYINVSFCPPQGQNTTNTDQIRTTSGDGQDTPACYILDHSFLAFPLNDMKSEFQKVSGHPSDDIGPILAKIESFLGVVRIYQHARFQVIPSMHSL